MHNINERPVCHRAEDLVTYLYGEATAEEARDFATHLRQCDACRAEFTVFNQVHESIVAWRNEALVSGALPQRETSASAAPRVFVTGNIGQHEKLSALAALREFFSVSPLWLRGATAFAGLLLCALLVFAASRIWQQSPTRTTDGSQAKYTEEQFKKAVEREVAEQIAKIERERQQAPAQRDESTEDQLTVQLPRHARLKSRPAKLTREETEQLAADLGLIPGREEEQPFVLPDEPDR